MTHRTSRAPTRPLAALLVCVVLVACAAQKAQAPKSYDEQPPQTVEEALAQLDRAESDIDRMFGAAQAQPGFAQPPGQAPTATEPMPAAPPPPPAKDDREAESEAKTLSASDPCETACRALASMERATEHLCGLAGETDERCGAARARIQAAGDRVRSRCPSC